MAAIENFILRFKVEGQNQVKQVSGTIRDLKGDIEGFAQVGGPLSNTINGIIGRLGPLGIAAGLAGAAFGALGENAINLADELSDLSDATGISASSLLTLRNSVVEAGGSLEDYQTIAAKLNQSVQEAASGNEKFGKAFQALGVYVLDVNGKVRPTQDILQNIVEKFKAGEISGTQYTAAIDTLGKGINRLDLKKLEVLPNPVTDEKIKALGEYKNAIDKLKKSIDDLSISMFGAAAQRINKQIEQYQEINKKGDERARKIEEELNKKGRTGLIDLGGNVKVVPGGGVSREMTAAEKERYAKSGQGPLYGIEPLVGVGIPLPPPPKPIAPPTTTPNAGSFRAPSEAEKKAAEEWEKRVAQSRAEIRKLSSINLYDEIANIEIQKTADIEKAKIDIMGKTDISTAKKREELALKTQEIELKAANDIRRLREETNKSIDDQTNKIKQMSEEYQNEYDLISKNAGLSSEAMALQEKLLQIEKQRKQYIEEAAKIKGIDIGQLAIQIDFINAEAEAVKNLAQQTYEYQRSFEYGWAKAFSSYVNNATNSAKIAENMFTSLTTNMNSALDTFVETGKFNFSDLAQSIIKDILKIQLRAAAANLFSAIGQTGAGSFLSGLFGGGKAIGGPVYPGTPYLVGERGPELFMPASAGSIVPNNKLSSGGNAAVGNNTYITNNISAIDSKSVAQLFAENRQVLFGNVEQARRELPLRTR